MNNWIQLSEVNLVENYRTLQVAAGPGADVLAVVKANAYGHGAEACSRVLAAEAPWFGVTCAAEGVRVRAAAGPAPEILVMSGFLPEDVPLLSAHSLTPVVWTETQVGWLGDTPGLKVHVEIDTGMSRQGVRPARELTALLAAAACARLCVDGIFTHFSASEDPAEGRTSAQQRLFEQAVAEALGAGARPRWIHAGNSSTLDNPVAPDGWLADLARGAGARAMVRSGLALYGYCLPTARPHVQPALRPVLEWRARILATREICAGDPVGYNSTFIAPAPMRVALVPAGYADGLRRELSGPHGWVIIDGQRAPILGRVSMNLTVVDVSHIPGAQAGDEVVLLGPGITAEDHARLAGTISYEILCGIHPCT